VPLKIAVLVKQVPDHEAMVHVASEEKLEIENRYVCSFFDEIAVEAALAIKKSNPDAELVALSAGGKRAVEALRRAVAMGIDQVEQVGDEALEDADSLYTAAVLAARLKQLGPDLILAGKQAGHDDMAAVGPMVAALMEIPHVSAVVSLEIEGEKAVIGRALEGEIRTLESGLPLLVTAEKGLAEPHVPVVTRVMKAMKAKIENIAVDSVDTGGIESGGRLRRIKYFEPPKRPPVVMVDDVPALVSELEKRGAL